MYQFIQSLKNVYNIVQVKQQKASLLQVEDSNF